MRPELWEERWTFISTANHLGLEEASVFLGIAKSTICLYRKRFGFQKWEAHVVDLRRLAEEGMTRGEAAAHLNLRPTTVGRLGREHEINFRHASTPLVDPRAEAMASMYLGGKTLEEIGALYGITRERVRQIIKKRHGLTGTDGGKTVRAKHSRDRRNAKQEAECLEKHGCSVAQLRSLRRFGREMMSKGESRDRTPLGAFRSQKWNANARGIGWTLKVWDWWSIWHDSGKWEERGRRCDGYVMCRFRDEGPYEIGNVYIATLRHNSTVQPNNPHRKGHPDFDKAMAAKLKRNSYEKRTCDVEGCDRDHYALGICRRHYDQTRASLMQPAAFEARAA